MARYLAIDWDQRELRCVVASSTAGRLKVRLAVAQSLVVPPAEGAAKEDSAPVMLDVGDALRKILAEAKGPRFTTLVGVDRASIELLRLTLPPANDDELPDMVLNQAMRESQLVTEESAVDFVPISADVTQPRRVLALALSGEHVRQIKDVCEKAGVKPRRIVLRSLATASLFTRLAGAPEKVCMLVNRIGHSADLIVVADGTPAFLRTIRLPEGDPEKAAHRLITEVQRSVAVALEDTSAESGVEAVYLLGRTDEYESLIPRLHEALGLPVFHFDPLPRLGIEEHKLPQHAEQFAPLVAMIMDEIHGPPPAIDFLNPRRTIKRGGVRRNVMLAVFAVAALFLGAGYYVWDSLAAVDEENATLEKQGRELKTLVRKAADQNKVVTAVHEWQNGDLTWLDELRDLAIRFPSARDMIVMRMSMTSAPRSGGGDIEIQGVVRDPYVVSRMEDNVRDKFHELRSPRVQERVKNKTYSWHFTTSIQADRRERAQYTSHLPQPPGAKEAATAQSKEPGKTPLRGVEKSSAGVEKATAGVDKAAAGSVEPRRAANGATPEVPVQQAKVP
jgi:Tfp pilus assembly PilM family ATPase